MDSGDGIAQEMVGSRSLLPMLMVANSLSVGCLTSLKPSPVVLADADGVVRAEYSFPSCRI